MVDYTKYRTIQYFQLEPPDEYRREYFIDEFNKISNVIDQYAQEFYPAKNARSLTDSGTATTIDDVLLCDGTLTVTLYDAAGKTDPNGIKENAGRRITIKNIGTGTVTVDTQGSQTIDGSATETLPSQWDVLELFSNGSNWFIING